MPVLELSFASKEDSLSVRHFAIREEISTLFEVDILARSPLDEIDLEAIVDHGAGFAVNSGVAWLTSTNRVWTGICAHMELVQTESIGLSTYFIKIVPALWRTTLRRNYRIFQHMKIPDIVQKVLTEWQIEPVMKLSGEYPEHEYRVQYGETDFAFISRMLEEAGISYFFVHEPPQSVSVSVPFLNPSMHVGAAHMFVIGLQKPLVQSLLPLHVCPLAQSPHVGPPQSTSVSMPFFFVSIHVGAAHVPPVHTWLMQSVPIMHILPSTHPPQVPPQSTSVSVPFFVMSPHCAV